MSENTRYSSEQNSERTHLDALDKAATQGEWVEVPTFPHLDPDVVAANRSFIVALVNAYRSGDLVPRVTSEEVREAENRLRAYFDPANPYGQYRDPQHIEDLDTLTRATAAQQSPATPLTVPDEVREALSEWREWKRTDRNWSAHEHHLATTIDRFIGGDE